jgi:hypothetical protein
MKCQLEKSTLGEPLANQPSLDRNTSIGVPTSSLRSDTLKNWAPVPNNLHADDDALTLVEQLRQEWNMLQRSLYLDSNRNGLSKGDLIKAWIDASGWSGREFEDLIVQSIADIFLKMDLSRVGVIQETDWLHYWLLEQQAPSFHALAQVNEKLLVSLRQDPKILETLNKLFLENCSMEHDAQLTAMQMKRVVELRLREQIKRNVKDEAFSHLAQLLRKRSIEEDEMFSYYDFMNHMLGRRKVKVQLYQYDLSEGAAKWLSPVLVGQQLEGIWHTSIVVHGREFWFGGQVFESAPGSTPFGTPVKIIDLPEGTMRTREDFVNYIGRVLAHEFTKDSYDVLTRNCNHFSDAAALFLLNCHIPQEILKQPDLVMGAWSMRFLRPVLNRILGDFQANESARGFQHPKEDGAMLSQDGGCISEGSLVVWEHEEGWTRIARVLKWCSNSKTCILKWLDVHTGELHTEREVKQSRILRLESQRKSRQKRPSEALVAGTFGARYHKQEGDAPKTTPKALSDVLKWTTVVL